MLLSIIVKIVSFFFVGPKAPLCLMRVLQIALCDKIYMGRQSVSVACFLTLLITVNTCSGISRVSRSNLNDFTSREIPNSSVYHQRFCPILVLEM